MGAKLVGQARARQIYYNWRMSAFWQVAVPFARWSNRDVPGGLSIAFVLTIIVIIPRLAGWEPPPEVRTYD